MIRDLTATSVTGGQRTTNRVASFPNPVNHTLHLRAAAQNSLRMVHVFSADGRLLQQVNVMNSAAEIDVAKFPPGLYVARIAFADGQTEVHRFIKGA